MKVIMKLGLPLLLFGLRLSAQPLTIYTEINAPFQFEGSLGDLTGLGVDVVREIQRREGNTDPIQVVPWARGYDEVQKRPCVVLFTMARTAERNARFQWVGPIEETVFSLFVKTDSPVRLASLDEARKLGAIGVYRDDVRDLWLTHAGFSNLERTVDNVANVKKLMAGRIDAFASTRVAIPDLARSAGFSPKAFREALPFGRSQGFIAFSAPTPRNIVERWAKALAEMKRDGTFERIHSRYFPGVPLPGPAISTF